MKKIFYLIGISALFLISSCNNDDIPQPVSEVKKYTPIVQGTFGKLTEANPEIGTRAGVIEDNDDYATEGEKFYWHDGDQVKLLFYQDGELKEELIYTATVDEDQPNKAQFNTTDVIDPGTYTVYGLYPADGWTVNGDDVSVAYDITIAQPYVAIEDETSKHLGRYMFMKADGGEVAIGDAESNSISLNFAQLASVIRIRITNPNPPNPTFTRLYRLSMGVNLGTGVPELGFESNFNPLGAYLVGGIVGTSLEPDEKTNVARVQIPNAITNLNMLDFDLFIPILPTGSLESSTIRFVGSFYNETGTTSTQAPPIDVSIGAGLPNGFEAGKSYYFNLTIPEID